MSRDEERVSWDAEADVVIVGAGAAGLAAGIEAAGIGAKTLVFEKRPGLFDSSTALSCGMFAFAGTETQRQQGIIDSNESFYADIVNVGGNKNDTELVRAYVDNQLAAYHWLEELGARWSKVVSAASGMSHPRGHSTDPEELIHILKRTADRCGVEFVVGAKANRLIANEQGRVEGVSVEITDGAQRTLNALAHKGVILTTGGFARNVKMLTSINQGFEKVAVTAGLGHHGDGHRMAEALGAYMKDMAYVKPSFELHVEGSSAGEILLMFCLGAVIVNSEGKRFVNESISYKDIGMASLNQSESLGFQIFDQKIFNLGVEKSREVSQWMQPKYFALGLDQARIKLLKTGSTVEELADKLHIPRRELVATIQTYNRYVDASDDPEFGRRTLSGNVGKPLKIDQPPFHGFATKSHFLATYAGVAVDRNMKVLGRQGGIAGLYAAGEVIGGFHGSSYHTGTALGKAVVFGRIAGANAARSA